jgi:hypothetical protein
VPGPIATLDSTTPKIPDELWRQSGIPATGWLVRGWIALVLIIAGWILAEVTGSVYLWALAAVGIALFFLLPTLVETLVLARLNAKVDAVELERNADKGHAALDKLRKNTTAKLLAPHGWLLVQEGRVHLAVGDGRAAAKAFAEAERVSTHADKHELISAQAHALVLAGDRKEARELLVKLRKSERLSDLDHLNYGVVLLSEAGHNQEALAHLQQARAAFGDHPRALAGLVLALQRCDKASEATALLREAEAAVEDSADQLAQDLLKRAKKGLRPLLKAQQKRERKVEKKPEQSEAASAEAGRKPKGKKGRKQSRRDARKKAKADARSGGEQLEAVAAGEEHEAIERDEATERDEAIERDEQAADEASSRAPQVEFATDDDRINHIEQAEEPVVAAEPPSAPVEIAASESEPTELEQAAQTELEQAEPPRPEPAIESPSIAIAELQSAPAIESPLAAAEPEPAAAPEPEAPTPEPIAATSSSTRAKPKHKDDDDDDIDLATLALEALGSGSRRKLDESEGGPSASGLRPIEPSASSGSLFRSALFDEPSPSASSSGPSLFSLPKLDSVPTFAPPPKPTRGPVLPSRPAESSSAKPAPAPKPESPKPESPKPAPNVPSVTPPKLGAVPSAPSIPAAKPVPSVTAPKPATPALDDGWGDLGELDPVVAPPPSPAVKDD